jgi:DNA invertase Pin-like site-specific DNA recombinase
VRIFADAARPGNTTTGRDSFLDMVEALVKNKLDVSGVLLWSYSRFARSFDDTAYYLASIRRAGYIVHSITDAIPDTLDGRLFESVLAWKDARQRVDLSRDIKRGKAYMVTVHHAWPGGRPPTGYQLEQAEVGLRRDGKPHRISRLVPGPYAEKIAGAFEMRAAGASVFDIYEHYPTLTGSVASLSRIINNPIYSGDLRYAGQLITNYCTPIVDREIWIAAQRVNKARRERHGTHHPRTVNSRFILTGLLVCARCGAHMVGAVMRRKPYKEYTYYRCGSYYNNPGTCGAPAIRKDTLERLVLDKLREKILMPQVLADLQARALEHSDDGNLERRQAELQLELKDLQSRITRIIAAIEQAGHSAALLKNLADLEEKHQEIQQRALQCELELSQRANLDLETLDVGELAASARELLNSGDIARQRTVVRGFVREIKVMLENEVVKGELWYYLPGEDTGDYIPL